MPPRHSNLGGLRTPRPPRAPGGFGRTGAQGSTAFRVGITTNLNEHYQTFKNAKPRIRKNFTAVLARNENRLLREMRLQAQTIVYQAYEPREYIRTFDLLEGNRTLRLATRLGGNFQLYAYNVVPYAAYVHEGYFVFNTGVYIPPRPWIQIAIQKIDPILQRELDEAVMSAL